MGWTRDFQRGSGFFLQLHQMKPIKNHAGQQIQGDIYIYILHQQVVSTHTPQTQSSTIIDFSLTSKVGNGQVTIGNSHLGCLKLCDCWALPAEPNSCVVHIRYWSTLSGWWFIPNIWKNVLNDQSVMPRLGCFRSPGTHQFSSILDPRHCPNAILLGGST